MNIRSSIDSNTSPSRRTRAKTALISPDGKRHTSVTSLVQVVGNPAQISYKYNFLTEGIVEKEHHLALKEEARRERMIAQSVQKDNEILRQRVQ